MPVFSLNVFHWNPTTRVLSADKSKLETLYPGIMDYPSFEVVGKTCTIKFSFQIYSGLYQYKTDPETTPRQHRDIVLWVKV